MLQSNEEYAINRDYILDRVTRLKAISIKRMPKREMLELVGLLDYLETCSCEGFEEEVNEAKMCICVVVSKYEYLHRESFEYRRMPLLLAYLGVNFVPIVLRVLLAGFILLVSLEVQEYCNSLLRLSLNIFSTGCFMLLLLNIMFNLFAIGSDDVNHILLGGGITSKNSFIYKRYHNKRMKGYIKLSKSRLSDLKMANTLLDIMLEENPNSAELVKVQESLEEVDNKSKLYLISLVKFLFYEYTDGYYVEDYTVTKRKVYNYRAAVDKLQSQYTREGVR